MTATVTKLPEMGSKDRPFERRSAGTLEAVLGYLGVELRFNIRARRIEIREGELGFLEDAEWMPATDRRIADLFDNIEGNYWVATKNGTVRLRYGRELRADTINALTHRREVDPFIEWLEDLPEWDGHELLDTVLTRNFGAPDDALSRWASKAPLIGAIRRAYEPGAKLDEIPILIGPQGIGKSAYVRSLLPPEFPEWHGDAIDLSAPNKEKAEALQGRVIVELSELSGLRRAEIEGVKSFVTRLDDGQHRAAYARNPETALRRCVFVGTSNDNSPLPNDPSGNRRFVPVVLSSGIWIEDIVDEVRELWWAEALARYHAGETGGCRESCTRKLPSVPRNTGTGTKQSRIG